MRRVTRSLRPPTLSQHHMNFYMRSNQRRKLSFIFQISSKPVQQFWTLEPRIITRSVSSELYRCCFYAGREVCGAWSMRQSGVRPSVCLSRRSTYAACRILGAGSRYRSTAAGATYRPAAAGAQVAAAGSVIPQRPDTKLNADLFVSFFVSKSTPPIFAKFSGLVELHLWMISLKLFCFDHSRAVAMATNFCWLYPHN